MIRMQMKGVSPLQKALATLLGITTLALLVVFSVVMIPLIIGIGLLAYAYFYWKTRALRKAMAEAVQDHGVIEGEAVVIREQDEIKHLN